MRKSRLSSEKQQRLLELFVTGATARRAADIVGVNFKTAVYYFHRLRMIIEQATQEETPLAGEVDARARDWSGVFDGKRDRGAAGRVPVLGFLMRGGRVYATVSPDTKHQMLKDVIDQRIVPDRGVAADHDRLAHLLDGSAVQDGCMRHSGRWTDNLLHSNGIENFWKQATHHLRRFNGIPESHFPLFVKECAWRFHTPDPRSQLQQLTRWAKQCLL